MALRASSQNPSIENHFICGSVKKISAGLFTDSDRICILWWSMNRTFCTNHRTVEFGFAGVQFLSVLTLVSISATAVERGVGRRRELRQAADITRERAANVFAGRSPEHWEARSL